MLRTSKLWSARRGSNAAVFALSMVPSFGFAALSIDLGFQRAAHAQLQASVDSIAESGASRLDGSDDGVADAKVLVDNLLAAHEVFGHQLDGAVNGVEFGTWSSKDGFHAGGEASELNAVRVNSRMPDLPSMFAMSFGRDSLGVSAESTAVAGPGGNPGAASEVECFIPLAIPGCLIHDDDMHLEDMSFKLSSDKEDTTGWAGLGEHPSASYVKSMISDCTSSGPAEVEDGIKLDNGKKTSGLKALSAAVNASSTPWDEDKYGPMPAQLDGSSVTNYGNVYEGPILFFNKPGEDFCDGDGGKFTGDAEIMAFGWGVVYDVREGGKLGEEIKMRLDVREDHEVDGSSDGSAPDVGVIAPGNGGVSYVIP